MNTANTKWQGYLFITGWYCDTLENARGHMAWRLDWILQQHRLYRNQKKLVILQNPLLSKHWSEFLSLATKGSLLEYIQILHLYSHGGPTGRNWIIFAFYFNPAKSFGAFQTHRAGDIEYATPRGVGRLSPILIQTPPKSQQCQVKIRPRHKFR